MPVITVEMWEGRDIETKRELVEKLTQTTSKVLNCPEEAVIVIIYDIPKHNWAQSGKLASDR
ncbi:MAG: 4-oxalocrotonate tautomerase [Endomicrobiia bacterium]